MCTSRKWFDIDSFICYIVFNWMAVVLFFLSFASLSIPQCYCYITHIINRFVSLNLFYFHHSLTSGIYNSPICLNRFLLKLSCPLFYLFILTLNLNGKTPFIFRFSFYAIMTQFWNILPLLEMINFCFLC